MISSGSLLQVRFSWMLLLAALLLGACGGGGGGGGGSGGDGVEATLLRVEISPASVSLARGTTRQLTATAVYSDGTTQNVTSAADWTPESAAVASVGNAGVQKGLLRGNAVGSTRVTVTFQGMSIDAPVTVTAATPSALSITPANPFIPNGLTRALKATVSFSDGTTQDETDSATWTSSSLAVATVNAAGVVTAIAPGSSVVTATFMSLTQTTTVTVTSALATGLAVTPIDPVVPVNGTQQFTAILTFSDATTRDVTSSANWISFAPARATISDAAGSKGLATARAAGTASIRASAMGLNAFSTMTVTDSAVVSIDVTPKNASVAVGFERPYRATALLNNGSTRDVTTEVSWTSSDTAVATIGNAATDKGIATGVAAGQTTITAQLGSVEGSTTLDVTAATLTAIGVTPANRSIALGLDQQFVAIGTFSDSSTLNVTDRVTWASSDAAVATISNADGSRGLASSLATGTTTVSASIGPTVGQTVLTVADAALTAIEITPASPLVAKGLTQPFTATGTFTDEVARDITDSVLWESSNTAIATISNDAGAMTQGLATAVQTGTTTIRATRSGVTATATLRVTAAVLQTIDVTPADASVPVGVDQAFTATGTYSDGTTANLTGLVTWASSQTGVATISNVAGSRGLATAEATGTTTISATSIGGTVVGSTSLTVTPTALLSIDVTPLTSTVTFGGTRQLTATGTYSDGTTRNITTEVTWAVVDPSIASVSNAAGSEGLATAAATVGSATITATDPDTMIDGAMTLTVVTALLTEIRVTPADTTLPAGYARQYTALGVYSDGSEQDVTTQVFWTSTAPIVATVSNAAGFKGVVSGVSAGSSTIRATLADGAGTNIVGQTAVTVTSATLASIAVTPGSALRPVGSTQQFQAVGTFSDGSTLPITEQVVWTSSEPSVATISNLGGSQGLATVIAGLLPITTTITATRGSVTGTASLSRGLL